MQLATPEQFAAAKGMGVRAAQLALQKATEGKASRGYSLPVVALPGNRGGGAGKVWALAVDRRPDEIKAKLGAVEGPLQQVFKGAITAWQLDIQAERRRIIEPILSTPKHSAERGDAFRAVAAQVHVFRGVSTLLAETTLRDWVRLFEDQGLTGLLPNPRTDKGAPRVLIAREWDKGTDLAPECREALAERVERQAKSMVAVNGTSIRRVVELAGNTLYRLCREAGSRLPDATLREICRLNKRWAQRIDLARYELVYLARKDHKLWQDRVVGRVNLALTDTPMSLLMGDVHYADIAVASGAEPVRVRETAARDKVNAAIRAGHLTPAMRDWATALCTTDPASFDDFVSRSPAPFAHLHTRVAFPPQQAFGAPGASLATDAELAVCAQLGLTPERLARA